MVRKTPAAYDVSERRACRVLSAPRATHRYQSVADDQAVLRLRIREIAGVHVTWGYQQIWIKLRREGWTVNRKRVYRLYREEGLCVGRHKPRRHRSSVTRPERTTATHANESWSLDFSRPGKPTDNGLIEAFNGRLRAECLNENWFLSLADAKSKVGTWRRHSNEDRPHSALGNLAPEEFAASSVTFMNIGGRFLIGDTDPLTTGNDAALGNDAIAGNNAPLDLCLYFANLEPGPYEVIIYAFWPNDPAQHNRLTVDFADQGPTEVGGGIVTTPPLPLPLRDHTPCYHAHSPRATSPPCEVPFPVRDGVSSCPIPGRRRFFSALRLLPARYGQGMCAPACADTSPHRLKRR